MAPVRIAVAGAGLIGASARRGGRRLCGRGAGGDRRPGARRASELAEKFGGARCNASLSELSRRGKPEGVILATPNQLHVDGGLECVAAGVPVIVEKPIGDSVAGATRAGRGLGGRPACPC